MLLSEGRTSRLYRSLVRDKKLAAAAAGFNGFPGNKYPNLFAFLGIPTAGHTASELADPIHAEIERLKTEDVSADELQSIKTRAKAQTAPPARQQLRPGHAARHVPDPLRRLARAVP